MRCTYCGSNLHPTRLCPKTYSGSANRLHLRCTYCGETDHAYEACPHIRAEHRRDENYFVKDKR